jgi:hypothetical protein
MNYYRVRISSPEPERMRGVLALAGIQSVVKDGSLSACLSATTAEKAHARVAGAIEGESASVDQPIPESL